ncbi:Tetraspanin family [Musa troglodytarum]|uniref:Tetraspanin family n=1 Tax=Musa troglodytarum TaxID=320322 RepID=A0A9E7EXD1_9LILI|nr:Tetraspanin family [Musa troglodytarum]
MSAGASTFVIRWINFFTMVSHSAAFRSPCSIPIRELNTRIVVLIAFLGLEMAVVCFGVWMSIHHDECRKSLTLPVIGLGALILLVFIITNNGSGHAAAGLRYKEYHLQDYSSWFLKQLNNTKNWRHLKSCLVKSEQCNNLPKRYKNLKEYKLAELSPIEAGCCRPPSECGYPAVNASYYDLSYHPLSTNKDCKLYKNARAIKCYDCDSCKAGVAEYMKEEWRVVAVFNIILFVALSLADLINLEVHPTDLIILLIFFLFHPLLYGSVNRILHWMLCEEERLK